MTPELRPAATEVALRLRSAGFEALFAGGCVRDRLLGVEPKDIDVATSARPEQVAALFPRTVPLGARFGCVQVHAPTGPTVEVTTFRTDGDYSDGRRPDAVAFGTDAAGDALRRDFTVNALFEDPATGAILDHVGGREDLRARRIRAVGDADGRFREDHLRVLRAIRFAARLGWNIAPDTMAAVRTHAPSVGDVAAERVRMELQKILVEGGAARGLDLLREGGLLPVVLPELAACAGVPQPPEFHPEGDVFVHTRLLLAGVDLLSAPRDPVLAWGALLHDIGKPPTLTLGPDRIRFDAHDAVGAAMAEAVAHRLRFSREETRVVRELVARHMQFRNLPLMREAKLRRFLAEPLFPLHLELHRLDCLAAHGDLELYDFCRESKARFDGEPPRPPRILTGRDLLDMGLEAGPRFAELLSAVEDAWLERRLSGPEEARALVRSLLASGGGDAAPTEERKP